MPLDTSVVMESRTPESHPLICPFADPENGSPCTAMFKKSEQRYFNIREALWFCCCSITPQGGGEAPKSPAARFFAATWWMFSFIIITQYTANLAAFLTVTNLERPVNDLEDLTLQTLIEYSAVNGSLGARYFENMAYIEDQFYE